jgi:hypothetical protein
MRRKMHFSQLFKISGIVVQPKVAICINGAKINPSMAFGMGSNCNGVDVTTLMGMDLDVDIDPENGIHTIVVPF